VTLSPCREGLDAKISSFRVLEALGCIYPPPAQVLHAPVGRTDQVVLTAVLRPWLEDNPRHPAQRLPCNSASGCRSR
jgi:hypothetical protein